MFKKILIGIAVLLFVASSVWLGYYFYNKANTDQTEYKTEIPFTTVIIKKTVATGSIVPRREIMVKPQVSGIVEALYVEAGQTVKAGQLIAKIRVVQNLSGKNNDMRSINSAENQLEVSKVNLNNALIELERQKKLLEQKMISQQEFNRFQLDYNLQKEAVANGDRNLNLIRQNALQNSGQVSNDIYSTIDGVLLDVPVKVGSSVIERSNFNEGTTIASIADMNSLIFEGKIDESEVGKLKEGMNLDLTIGAIEGKIFKAKLEYIAPKGTLDEGAIKFQIKAQVVLEQGDFIRAGYSANADIVLERKENVMAVKESLVQFQKDSIFVEVEAGEKKFEKKLIKTGISDGINVEILSGIEKDAKIKVPSDKKVKQS